MKNLKKILIIIQRSNGDVFFSSPLIKKLHEYYGDIKIDLLVNEDTISIAKIIPFVQNIYTFSYQKKNDKWWAQERDLVSLLFRRYDLSINLTASDRSVLYAIFFGKKSISAIEQDIKKSWWKKVFLYKYYYFKNSKHILEKNLEPLNLLDINFDKILYPINPSEKALATVSKRLNSLKIKKFIIFHPSTQYRYKVYPEELRNKLLTNLNELGVPIVITGGSSALDEEIKEQIPKLPNIFDFISKTTLEEFFALSELSIGYIGMDTLNMHVAASQNKKIFAIFGPTNLTSWSPWSNILRKSADKDAPLQSYANVTIFQANMPCVACGKAGCDDNHGKSDCLDNINPDKISIEVKKWLDTNYKNFNVPIEII